MAENRARDRLTALFHEQKTPHNGRYLTRPWQQRATPWRNQGTVHDLTEKAEQALEDVGLLRKFAPAHAKGMWWMHDFMLACATSSIELACLQTKGEYQYIFHDEICARIGGPLSFPVTFENSAGKQLTRELKPDRAFGIRYPDKSVRLFLVEADRSTEPLSGGEGRKSLYENDLQYRAFIRSGQYKDALQISGGVMVMNLLTSETRMRNVACGHPAVELPPVCRPSHLCPRVPHPAYHDEPFCRPVAAAWPRALLSRQRVRGRA